MRVLIMGGTQFVSSSLAQHLIKKGYDVDIFTRGKIPISYKGYKTHLKGDRKSLEELKKQLSGKQYEYVFDISVYTKDDIVKFLSVLDKTKLKNYIFCSSGSVYLSAENYESEDAPRGVTEAWGQYGLDKMEAEDYLFDLNEKENFPMTIFRPTYIFGEGNNLYREIYFFDRILTGKDIPIPYGDKRV